MDIDSSNNVVTSLFTARASDFGVWSGLTHSHNNMIYHQLALLSSGVLAAGAYNIRMIIGEDGSPLGVTVYTGRQLVVTGVDNAFTNFNGAMLGLHLEVATALSGGETISCILTSSTEPLGEFMPPQVV